MAKIHIKKKNRGKFTASAKKAGQSVQEHARSVLNNPNATPLQKKRANFARNAAKWKHPGGGIIGGPSRYGSVGPEDPPTSLAPGWQHRLGYPVSAGSVQYNWEPVERTYDPVRKGYVTRFQNENAPNFSDKSLKEVGYNPAIVRQYPTTSQKDINTRLEGEDNYSEGANLDSVRKLYEGNTRNRFVEEVKSGMVDYAQLYKNAPGNGAGYGSIEAPYESTVFQADPKEFNRPLAPYNIEVKDPKFPIFPVRPTVPSKPFAGFTSATDIGLSRKGRISNDDKKRYRPTKYSAYAR